MKNRIILKGLSAWLALSLLYLDFAWALDVRQAIVDAKKSFEEMDEARKYSGMGINRFEQSEASQASEVQNQTALQELQSLNFSLTTPNGDIIRYIGNRIDTIERADGTILNNVSLDEAGNIIGADLRLADGSIQIYRDGNVIGYRQPNGTQVFYENGEVTRSLSLDGTETHYSYTKDAQGAVTETVLTNARFEARYGADGILTRLWDMDEEQITEFTGGLPALISFLDGSSLTFKHQDLGDRVKVTPLYFVSPQGDLFNYAGQVESPFEYAIYWKETKSPKEIKTSEGIVLAFDGDGLLKSAVDAGGNAVEFEFLQSALSHFTQTRVTAPGIASTYDAEGRLESVAIGELTFHYKKNADTIEWIEKADGTELWDLVFDAAGNLTGTTIYDAIGNVSVYEDGALKSHTSHENVRYDFFDGQIERITTPEAFVYHLSYTPDKITAELDSSLVPDALTPVRMEYDTAMNLKKLVRQNQEILNYLDNELVRIDFANDAPQSYSYEKDLSGKVVRTTVVQGNVTTVYDAFGQPVSSVISPDEDNPHTLNIAYQYGKIREVRKDGVLTLTYSYSFKNDGTEVTQIEDVEEQSTKKYERGLLVESFDQVNSILSSYGYVDKKVSRVEVTRFGRVLHTYDYAYEGDNTIVTDEEGVVRTYSTEQKLLFLDRDNTRFRYSYNVGEDGKEIVREELIERVLQGGAIARYSEGRVTEVVLPDGLVLQDLVRGDDGGISRATIVLADGTRRVFDGVEVLEEILPDGTHYYFDGGKVIRVVDAAGIDLEYEYEILPNRLDQFYDRSDSGKEATLVGGADVNRKITRNGQGAIDLAAVGDALRISDSDDFHFANGDFTIDLWLNVTTASATNRHILGQHVDGSNWWSINLESNNALHFSKNDSYGSVNKEIMFAHETGRWYHVAVVREGAQLSFFIDGIKMLTTDYAGVVLANLQAPLIVGNIQGASQYTGPFQGLVENVRILKGKAAWNQNFAPPGGHTADGFTKLLIEGGNDREILDSVKVKRNGLTYRYSPEGDFEGFEAAGRFFSEVAQFKLFEDRSSARHAPIFQDGAKLDETQSRFGQASIRFDGDNDAVVFEDSADWAVGSGDFTIDFWINIQAQTAANRQILGQHQDANNYWMLFYESNNWFHLYKKDAGGTVNKEFSWNPTTNAWHHFAMVRSGNRLIFFVDGVILYDGSLAGIAFPDLAGRFYVGNYVDNGVATQTINGRVEDIRFSKGVARWTSAFTAPPAAAAPDAQTNLLLQQYGVSIPGSSIFQSGSDYAAYSQDGELLQTSIVDSSVLTGLDEYAADMSAGLPHFDRMNKSGSISETITGIWKMGELAETIASGELQYRYSRWWVEGERRTFFEQQGVQYGFDDGELSGIRLDGIYYAHVPTLKLFADESSSRHGLELMGGAALSKTGSRFGGNTLVFDGAQGWASFKDSPDWAFGSGDFTVDFWLNIAASSATNRHLVGQYQDASNFWSIMLESNNAFHFYAKTAGAVVNREVWFTPPVGSWSHVAVARAGSTMRFFFDGVLAGSFDVAGVSLGDFNAPLTAGYFGNAWIFNGGLSGRIEELRVTKGAARWTAGFTPPSARSAPDAATRLLVHDFERQYAEKKIFQSDNGWIVLDDDGAVFDYSLSQILPQTASFLGAVPTTVDALPYETSNNLLEHESPRREEWFGAAGEAMLDAGAVAVQEYSADGVLETQTHADGTVTLFDDEGRPDQVLDDKGNLLIQYLYDADGNLTRVYLKNARETLPDQIIRAKAEVEEARQKQLLELAEARSVAFEEIEAQADAARAQILGQINYIQGEIGNLEAQGVHGKQAKRAKSQALDDARGVLNSVWGQWSDLHATEADAYAALDAQIGALSNEIKADADAAFAALDVQERALKREILRQEISPVIYDRYRRVLGRDPSSAEYDNWLSKMDYETGEVIVRDETQVTIDPGASVRFDGTNDYLTIPDSNDWTFGQADFTIELNVRFNSFSKIMRGLVEQSNAGTNGWKLYHHNSTGMVFTVNGSTVVIKRPWAPTTGRWYHVALVRSGNAWRLFVDGVQLGATETNSTSIPNYTQGLAIGAMHDGGIRYYLNGWLDGLHISSTARYGSNFAPSSYRQSPDPKSVLLLEVDRATGSLTDKSAAARAVTRLNGVTTSTSQYKLSKRTEIRIIEKAALTTALDDHLNALPELAERQAYVAAIKSQVVTLIQSYLTMTAAQKTAFASSLGLAPDDLIPLSSSDAQKIIVWLDTRSLHFGQSAFLSLESLLDQKGIPYARDDLATKAILIDILTGVITPLDEGDLIISIFALQKVGKLFGLDTSALNLSWQDLAEIYADNPTARIVVHINGIHFVVITGINTQAGTITYTDMGAGKDKSNESVTASKSDFLGAWKGNILLDVAIAEQAKQSPQTVRELTTQETKEIRGAFFVFLIPIFVTFFAGIGTAIAGIAAGITAIAASVGVFIGGIIGGIGGILSGIGAFLFNAGVAVFQAIQWGIASLFSGVGGLFGGLFSGQGFGALGGTLFGSSLFDTAVKVGLNLAINLGFDALGISPEITRYVSAFVSGGITGGFADLGSFLSNGLLNIAPTLGNDLGLMLDLDPIMRNAIGMLAGGFIDGFAQISVPGGFTATIAESFLKAGSYYGISELGASLGFDPQITNAFVLPVLGAIDRSFDAGRLIGQDIVQSILDSFSHGGIQLGLNFAINELDLDNPLLEALASATITSTISSLLDPNGSLFEDLLRSAKEATIELLQNIQTTDFAELMFQVGFEEALGIVATSAFSRQALEEIHSVGGIAQLISGRATHTEINGVPVTEIKITDQERFYLGSNGSLYATMSNGELKIGQFSVDNQDNVYFVNGMIEKTLSNGHKEIIQIQSGSSVHVTYSVEGQPIISIKVNSNSELNIGSLYEISDGVIYFQESQAEIEFTHGYVTRVNLGNIAVPDGFNFEDLNLQSLTPEETKTLIEIVLLNGFAVQLGINGDAPGTIQEIFQHDSPFIEKLNELEVSDNAILPIPFLEQTPLAGDITYWMMDTLSPITPLTNFIEKQIRDILFRQEEPFVPLAYSGSGQPLLRALDRLAGDPDNNIETAILVGVPLYDAHMDNLSASLKRIINIYGTLDLGLREYFLPVSPSANLASLIPTRGGAFYTPTIAKEFTSNYGLQTINIELVGIEHDMYFLSPDNVQEDPTKAILNDRANTFMAVITSLAMDENVIEFLDRIVDPIIDPNKPSILTYSIDLLDNSLYNIISEQVGTN